MKIEEAIRLRFLLKVKPDKQIATAETDEAEYDLDKARKTFEEKDYKWSIVKSYYSMFHAGRAVLFSIGLREKKHFAVGVVLADLAKKGKIEQKYVDDFEAAMDTREDADYRRTYSKDTANFSLLIAEEFLNRMKQLVKELGR